MNVESERKEGKKMNLKQEVENILESILAEDISKNPSQKRYWDRLKEEKKREKLLQLAVSLNLLLSINKPNLTGQKENFPPEIVEYCSEWTEQWDLFIPVNYTPSKDFVITAQNRVWASRLMTMLHRKENPKKEHSLYAGLGSPNTWERGKD